MYKKDLKCQKYHSIPLSGIRNLFINNSFLPEVDPPLVEWIPAFAGMTQKGAFFE